MSSVRGGAGCHKCVREPKVCVIGPPETIISFGNSFQPLLDKYSARLFHLLLKVTSVLFTLVNSVY